MSDPDKLRARIRINKQGRIVIPIALRRAAGINPGEEVVASVEDGRLVLEGFEALEQRLLSWFAEIPNDVSLVDELISQRREEARREDEEAEAWLQAHPLSSS